jgi:AcrR family transcriptional regulator
MCGMENRPVSRRERPAKPPLTRDGIVDAAMAVLDGDGFDKLTMRRLATDLDTGPASLYVYVRDTQEIHARLIDRLLADLDVSWSGRGDWRPRLRRLLVDYIGVLLKHPGLARSAVTTWPQGPHYLDLVEFVLRLLTAGGVPPTRAAWGVDVLLQQATAMAAEYGTRGDDGDGQDAGDLLSAFDDVDPGRHPNLARLGAAAMAGGEHGPRRDWAIDALIAGITATPRPGE